MVVPKRGKDGKFAGSIGRGKTQVPSARTADPFAEPTDTAWSRLSGRMAQLLYGGPQAKAEQQMRAESDELRAKHRDFLDRMSDLRQTTDQDAVDAVLADAGDAEVRALLYNPNLRADQYVSLAGRVGNPEVRGWLVTQRHFPAEALERVLEGEQSRTVLAAVASREDLPRRLREYAQRRVATAMQR